MKKLIALLLIAGCLQSCAMLMTPHPDSCQTTIPKPGQAKRAMRPGFVIADVIIFWPLLLVDIYTDAIYRPCDKINVPSK